MKEILFLLETLMGFLFIMIVMAINVSALEFSFDYPMSVEVEQEFEVTINANAGEDIYDVKIFVYDGEPSEIVSEIYFEGEWENPYYYLQDVFPEQDTFSIKVLDFTGDTEICVRMRKADESNYDQVCNEIEILERESSDQSQNNENNDVDETEDGEIAEEPEKEEAEQEIEEISLGVPEVIKKEKIVLNPPIEKQSSKIDGRATYVSSQEKLRFAVLLSFLIFAVILIVLLALRKL